MSRFTVGQQVTAPGGVGIVVAIDTRTDGTMIYAVEHWFTGRTRWLEGARLAPIATDADAMSDDEIGALVSVWPSAGQVYGSAGNPVWAGITELDDGSAVGMEANGHGQRTYHRWSNSVDAADWLDAIELANRDRLR